MKKRTHIVRVHQLFTLIIRRTVSQCKIGAAAPPPSAAPGPTEPQRPGQTLPPSLDAGGDCEHGLGK